MIWYQVRSTTHAQARKHKILCNNIPIPADHKLQQWDILTLKDQTIIVQRDITLLMYKPAWYVSTDTTDRRPSYRELLMTPYRELVHAAGRLDADSTGLLLLTSDGDLIHEVTSPRRHRPKTYHVTTRDEVSISDIALLSSWLQIGWYTTLPCVVDRLWSHQIQIILQEGKFHQIKKMLQAVWNEVVALHRTQIWPYTLEWLQPGEYKEITSLMS